MLTFSFQFLSQLSFSHPTTPLTSTSDNSAEEQQSSSLRQTVERNAGNALPEPRPGAGFNGRPRKWEPYVQLPGTGSRKGGGVGLLSTCDSTS